MDDERGRTNIRSLAIIEPADLAEAWLSRTSEEVDEPDEWDMYFGGRGYPITATDDFPIECLAEDVEELELTTFSSLAAHVRHYQSLRFVL